MGFGRGIQAGRPHTLTPARAAQLHRWQLMGAAARRGKHTAAHEINRARLHKYRGHHTIRSIGRAAAWGVQKTVLPTSLVTPIIPGYQPGDRTYMPHSR